MREAIEKFGDLRTDQHTAHRGRAGKAQQANRLMLEPARLGFGFIILGEDIDGAAIEALACFRQAERAGRALEQCRTEDGFEVLDAAGDRRLAQFEVNRGAGKAARVGHSHEQAHCINPVQLYAPHADSAWTI